MLDSRFPIPDYRYRLQIPDYRYRLQIPDSRLKISPMTLDEQVRAFEDLTSRAADLRRGL